MTAELPVLVDDPGTVEEVLPGGNVGGAVRVGSTVRRPTGPWTPAVHELLAFVADAGLDLVPRVLGTDARGREALTYLPGHVVPIGVEDLTDAQVASTMAWLRRFHETVAGFPRDTRRWRFAERGLGPGEIVCHHDVATYNLVFDGDALAGVLDWDVAGPGVPLDDVAIFAWNGPLLEPEADAAAVARGLRLVASSYGDVDPHDLLDHVPVRMANAVARIAAGARAGDPGMRRLGTVGEPDRTRRRLARLLQRTAELHDAIG
ncbi:phosphotransferase [Cellulomonas massiliensis]|uniref:phosphotransferase n=1 Tax=Cellulomonas massiliensis TaxID=1465811 RepID=UPI000377787C|nr:phosphotransferase [Cellulomonas massiliensis]